MLMPGQVSQQAQNDESMRMSINDHRLASQSHIPCSSTCNNQSAGGRTYIVDGIADAIADGTPDGTARPHWRRQHESTMDVDMVTRGMVGKSNSEPNNQ